MDTTISESDGSVSQYRYTGVTIKLEDAGTWRADDTVRLTVAWRAGQRINI